MPPTVTIIVPVHNVADYLGETLRSIQRQSLNDWELIIVDDGSTDQTGAVIAGFAGDARIRSIAQPQSGVAAARNRALEAARGRFLAFLDGDDLWHPQFLERCIAELERNGTDLCACAFSYLLPNGRRRHRRMHRRTGRMSSGDCLRLTIPWQIPLLMGNVVLRRTAPVASLQFRTGCRTGEDTEYYLKVLCAIAQVSYLNERLFCYRRRPGSATQQRHDWRPHDDSILAMDRARAHFAAHYPGADKAELLALFDDYQSFRRYRMLYLLVKRGAHHETRKRLTEDYWRHSLVGARRRAFWLQRVKLGVVSSENQILWTVVERVERARDLWQRFRSALNPVRTGAIGNT